MIALTETLTAIAQRFADGIAFGESAEIADCLDAAAEWAAARLPLEVFARVGTTRLPRTGKPSAAYTRYLATIATPATDPRRADLLRAIDALLDLQGYRRTNHGVFDADDLHGMTIRYRKDAA